MVRIRPRCEAMNEAIDSRCVLEDNHAGEHVMPNLVLKTENRFLFDRLRNIPHPLNHHDSLFKMISKLKGFKKPPSQAEKERQDESL